MESRYGTLLLVLCASIAFAAASSINDEYTDFKHLMKILSKPRMLDRYKFSNAVLHEKGMVQGLKWSNCGSSTDPLQVKSLSISPDPVKVPGNITVSVDAVTGAKLRSPLKIELTIKKKILVWIEIPCIDNVGSCTYNDICTNLATVTCPPELLKYGIKCRCPFKKGEYSLPSTDVTIPAVGLPEWLEEEYKAEAKLSTDGQPLGCISAQLSLTKGSRK